MIPADPIVVHAFIAPHKREAFVVHGDETGGHLRLDWFEEDTAAAIRLVLLRGQRLRVTFESAETEDQAGAEPKAAADAPRVRRWNDKLKS